MSRKCVVTGKKPRSGHNRPFSLKATGRIFRPNLFKRRVYNPFTGCVEKIKVSAKGIKTLKKWEKEMFGDPLENTSVPANNESGEGKHVKKQKFTPKQKKELAAAEEAKKKEEAKTKVAKEMENTEKTKKSNSQKTQK